MKKPILILLLLGILIVTGCKKDEPICLTQVVPTQPNIAPCTLTDTIYPNDSVFYGNSSFFPTATFSVNFEDTVGFGGYPNFIEFAFNKIPTTGMYYLVSPSYLGSPGLENQITYYAEFNGMGLQAAGTNDSTIYIENNQNEIIISFCDFPNQGFSFDPTCNCYVGNGSGNLKYRKEY